MFLKHIHCATHFYTEMNYNDNIAHAIREALGFLIAHAYFKASRSFLSTAD